MKLCIFVTHPVQYHVPLWRALAAHPELDVRVFYFSDHSVRGDIDKGFGVPVKWDVDLLSGYSHSFLSRSADLSAPGSVKISDPGALLELERPDWVWISGYTMGFERQLARAARQRGIPILIRAEFSDLSFEPRSLPKNLARAAYLRWFYRHLDRFCYPGQMAKDHLLKHGVPPEKMFFSPYSVDDALIQQARAALTREDARAALGIPADRCMLLLSGKLIPRKAPLVLLDALSRLADTRKLGLIAVGDGELRAPFQERAHALLAERFVYPGFVNQSQLGRFFLAADVHVMPSLHETWGLVVNEAMHYGLPSIVSDQVGCHPDLVLPGRTGFVHAAGSVNQLAALIQTLLDETQTARSMGLTAEALARDYTIRASALGVFKALGIDAH